MMGCHGLSPLARGTREFQDFSSLFPRFIPAGAGNTHSSGNTDNVGTVYPRWRGEHMRGWMHGSVRCGLSPLARGTQSRAALDYQYGRFIPAGAGNTHAGATAHVENTVYPRWRGEHSVSTWWRSPIFGLSPLARGTLNVGAIFQQQGRFIPAGAGNTRSSSPARCRCSVYPRWRGEHESRPRSTATDPGLSPLARGTLRPRYATRTGYRFIPAGAGNTPGWPARG